MRMVISITENGSMEKQMDTVYLLTVLVHHIKENGLMISSMDLEQRVGIMERSNT